MLHKFWIHFQAINSYLHFSHGLGSFVKCMSQRSIHCAEPQVSMRPVKRDNRYRLHHIGIFMAFERVMAPALRTRIDSHTQVLIRGVALLAQTNEKKKLESSSPFTRCSNEITLYYSSSVVMCRRGYVTRNVFWTMSTASSASPLDDAEEIGVRSPVGVGRRGRKDEHVLSA